MSTKRFFTSLTSNSNYGFSKDLYLGLFINASKLFKIWIVARRAVNFLIFSSSEFGCQSTPVSRQRSRGRLVLPPSGSLTSKLYPFLARRIWDMLRRFSIIMRYLEFPKNGLLLIFSSFSAVCSFFNVTDFVCVTFFWGGLRSSIIWVARDSYSIYRNLSF